MTNIRDGFSAHPAAVPIVLRRRQSSVESLRVMEAMLAVLTEGVSPVAPASSPSARWSPS